MPDQVSKPESLRPVITAEQVEKRVLEMARQISDHYRGRTLHVVAVLENSFMFMADLVRLLEVPVVCTFIKPHSVEKQQADNVPPVVEIFFSAEVDIRGKHVLLVEGLVNSGVTTDFLMADLRARGAASVKLATLLDRQTARRVQLQPDYFGFLVDEPFLVGYGLASSHETCRNLPFLAISNQQTR
jgi:hypoxanthine phosphoribosyltransferase